MAARRLRGRVTRGAAGSGMRILGALRQQTIRAAIHLDDPLADGDEAVAHIRLARRAVPLSIDEICIVPSLWLYPRLFALPPAYRLL